MLAAESVLLRRIRTVYVDPASASGGGTGPGGPALRRLEAELLGRGHVLTLALHEALASLTPEDLAAAHTRLVGLVDALLGSDRTHTPLFRGFPRTVPRDTEALYVDRVFAFLLQQPDQPCVLCGEGRTVFPVSPCAHLVCRLCWDGSDYAGCPVCHRRVDADEPFLRPVRAVGAAKAPVPGPLRLLCLGTDRARDATGVVDALLARRTPLSPQDRDDLLTLLPLTPAGRGVLPAEIPVRETKATVLGALVREAWDGPRVRTLLAERLTTATDVLRLLAVLSGGDAGLVSPSRFTTLPRPLRRDLLAVLDGLPTPYLVEDVLRHPTAWKRAAEVLHPFERHARHPRAALAFAVLRRTPVDPGTSLGSALLKTAAAHPDAVRADEGPAADDPTGGGPIGGTAADDAPAGGRRIRPATWAGRLEQAIAEGDAGRAALIAGERPGELLRRLDQLLRLHTSEELAPELERALLRGLPKVGPGPLLSAFGALRVRSEDRTGRRRVFFPRGDVTRALTVPERRAPLPAALVTAAVTLLRAEVLRRFTAGEPYALSVLDAGLADLTVPFTERSTAKSLVAVPRGSTQTLPPGAVLRLFLHWTEPEGMRTDLDLSVAFFDADWTFTGLCDYTSLVHGAKAAVHSGDLTSAPAPRGATEYVDLDLKRLAGQGDVYAVPLVLSYNNVPFEELGDAFAGFMALPAQGPRDASYDPRAVRQRFDLAGDSKVCLPMIVELGRRRALWTDTHLPATGGFQSVGSHGGALTAVARDLWEQFGSGSRTTLWDLTVWRAAARSPEVAVVCREPEPALLRFRRRPDEDTAAFAVRVHSLHAPEERLPHPDPSAAAAELAAGARVFLATVHGDIGPAGATGTCYRLFPGAGDASESLTRVAAGDLVAELTPAPTAAPALPSPRPAGDTAPLPPRRAE
ncbi:MXAN_6230/SCO0854 family RING domain-containing protein [Streptomyces fragilis]|uniref:MXAN_6230/SCO0854 family RING domain-containing protein n=1 Tax=Streptomyces fragilis TaxID=67301 RepID=A0ABV2YES0_9ACTN|nr:MXAN_6230/SCO0854 family RING domain-containing protein [Streptomyces fragilis]